MPDAFDQEPMPLPEEDHPPAEDRPQEDEQPPARGFTLRKLLAFSLALLSWGVVVALVALSLTDPLRLQQITHAQGRIILALDGLQPDVGHEVLWVLRDCLSAEVLLARSLLSATQDDLADLIDSVRQALGVPIGGGISDGQPSLRCAVANALPNVPHQLCHFHYVREAAKAVYEADRHAK